MSIFKFNDKKLLLQALTHRSFANENSGIKDNERLEFLGDAILPFISAEYFYRRYPEMGEDEMTRRRSALGDEQQLAQFALQIGLDSQMRLSKGTLQDGGLSNPNLLSSTFEAMIGAYYLDQNRNIETIRRVIEVLFDSVPPALLNERGNLDVKNQLQQLVQLKFGHILPTYKTEKIGGSDHAPEYLAEVMVEGQIFGSGKGRGKKAAEKQAAENALANFNVDLNVST